MTLNLNDIMFCFYTLSYQGEELVVSDEIRARARQWEPKSSAVEMPTEETESKAVDAGAVSLVPIKPSRE